MQTLEGAVSASNTADQPHAIKPTTVAWKHRLHAGETTVTFPAHTFTVIRL